MSHQYESITDQKTIQDVQTLVDGMGLLISISEQRGRLSFHFQSHSRASAIRALLQVSPVSPLLSMAAAAAEHGDSAARIRSEPDHTGIGEKVVLTHQYVCPGIIEFGSSEFIFGGTTLFPEAAVCICVNVCICQDCYIKHME